MWTPTIGDGDQALNYTTLLRYVQANAVLSGLDVTINTGTFDASDTLSVASGTVLVDGTEHNVSSTTVGISSATDFPRKDLVYVDGTGSVEVVEGQEAIDSDGDGVAVQPEGAVREATYDPSVPDLSGTTGTPLVEIWVDPDASSLQSADRVDRRPPGRVPIEILEAINADDLNFDTATQAELDSHADTNAAHHSKYTDSDARSAVEGNTDAADLTGESGTDGQVLTSDGTNTAWESSASGTSFIYHRASPLETTHDTSSEGPGTAIEHGRDFRLVPWTAATDWRLEFRLSAEGDCRIELRNETQGNNVMESSLIDNSSTPTWYVLDTVQNQPADGDILQVYIYNDGFNDNTLSYPMLTVVAL